MNAPRTLFIGGLAAVALTGPGLSGCALQNPLRIAPIDPKSPVAADAARIAGAPVRDPEFTDIPAVDPHPRPPRTYGESARTIEAAGARLLADTAPGTWTLTRTEAFVAAAQDAAGPALPEAASTTVATESFAREQRKRATPPPPPKR